MTGPHDALATAMLDALAAGGTGPVDADHVVVVVAHPDDETLMLGGQLPRLAGARILHVTDGAPRDGADAGRCGFACPADYAAARRRELERAMTQAGVPLSALSALLVPDQGAAEAMGWIALHLRDKLEGARIVFTHAYEGGHPDHDAVALAVHLAAELIAARGGEPPAIVEAPLYRDGSDGGDGGWLRRDFAADDRAGPVWRLALTPAQESAKAALLACFVTQSGTLAGFPLGPELFRLAPARDGAGLPPGPLLYERHDWGMDGRRFLLHARAARALAGLPEALK
ncbi:PIG-L family deacetylase [Alsobacter sp. SYSU M60028]|uniref:PIG-L family deacetylase n=1 Tax=Alsobacter ponti TaxID=2962936 RepID=A0ABT1LBU0_9HYPH|nr:PIG-L family deacetylase [Alsobacter ponti]MCP8938929.1 PIG-L family deacetylase [Alsobacter ponti]